MLERVKEIINQKGMTVANFALAIGMSPGTIEGYYQGRRKLSLEAVDAILRTFPDVSAEWLLRGDGEDVSRSEIKGKSPYFDMSTIEGGKGAGNGNESFSLSNAAGYMYVPGLPNGDNIPYIQVHGNSMLNRSDQSHSIPEGSWIALSECTSTAIHWGEVYAFMTYDGPIVKKLMPSEKDGCVSCVSFNVEDGYLPFDQPTSEIIGKLYKVVGVVGPIHRW